MSEEEPTQIKLDFGLVNFQKQITYNFDHLNQKAEQHTNQLSTLQTLIEQMAKRQQQLLSRIQQLQQANSNKLPLPPKIIQNQSKKEVKEQPMQTRPEVSQSVGTEDLKPQTGTIAIQTEKHMKINGNIHQSIVVPQPKEALLNQNKGDENEQQNYQVVQEKPSKEVNKNNAETQSKQQSHHQSQEKQQSIIKTPPPPNLQHYQDEPNLKVLVPSTDSMNNLFDLKQSSIQTLQLKMFQIFQRLQKLEQKQIHNIRLATKNYQQLQSTMQNNIKTVDKFINMQTEYKQELREVRQDLVEYKLKKQAKMNKMMNSNNGTNNNGSSAGMSNQSLDFIVQKLQFLMKTVDELVPNRQYEKDNEHVHAILKLMKEKQKDLIPQNHFHQTIKTTQLKIYQTIHKYIKGMMHKDSSQSKQQQQNQLQKLVDEHNQNMVDKIDKNEKQMKEVKEIVEDQRKCIESMRGVYTETEIFLGDRIKKLEIDLEHFGRSVDGIIKKVSLSGEENNSKHSEIEQQIADTQQSVEKIEHQLKFYRIGSNQSKGLLKTDVYPSEENLLQSPSSQHIIEKLRLQSSSPPPITQLNPQTQNQINTLRKKLTKLAGKLQSTRQELKNLKSTISNQFDMVKQAMDKKSDWQSLKKGLNYFDERNKEVRQGMREIYDILERAEKDEPVAAKKGWTCLMCDKQIKNYQGKLGDVKFMGFPGRQAPKIGGYFKQHQNDKIYKDLYMNQHKSRRLTSLSNKKEVFQERYD